MDIQAMHTLFKMEYDKVDSANKPLLTPVKIDFMLNDATQTFVKQRYRGIPPKNEGFEETQKRRDDLSSMVVPLFIPLVVDGTEFTPGLYDSANTQNYLIPLLPFGEYPGIPNYWHYISSWLNLEFYSCGKTDGSTKKVKPYPKMLQQDDYMATKWSQITKPNMEKPYLTQFNNTPDGTVVNNVFELDLGITTFNGGGNIKNLTFCLRYLRKPPNFGLVLGQYPFNLSSVTDCPLSDETHQEIVQTAVLKMLEIIEQPRTASYYQAIFSQME